MSKWIAQFAGQATPWRAELTALASDPEIGGYLRALYARAEEILQPVGIFAQLGAGDPFEPTHNDRDAAVSVPGILLAQLGAYRDVVATMGEACGAYGHSQGVLAAEAISGDAASVLAIARLIGAAASLTYRAPGGQATPMVAWRGPIPSLPAGVSLAIRNSADVAVLSGDPAELSRLVATNDLAEYLAVSAPFHHQILEPAVALVAEWAAQARIDIDAERLARAVLTDVVDFPRVIEGAVADGQTVINIGPGNGLQKAVVAALQGSGATVIDAGTTAARDDLACGRPRVTNCGDWSAYAPSLRTVDGRVLLETAFTRLTGRSAILVGGMTPTTVDPAIVAAAVNAGHWAELAGGGQVTEEILHRNIARLNEALDPDKAAQFNAMYLDRYQWDFQFARKRAVIREREAGARLDGVVISAGVPELDEAVELVQSLREAGFPYVAFKPGTVAQIRQVVAIANAVLGDPIIAMVEGGQAGGHHSWEDLGDILAATYGELRAAGVVVCAGGGLGDPQRAADYLDGSWSVERGLRPMPVDGVFVGTPLMAAREALTSEGVKEALVAAPGIDSGWVRRAEVRGGVTSGLSQLHADLYELENASARAARLIAAIAPEDVAAHREDIIEAIAGTAKPYFGDVESMTYAQMLHRFAELAHPWADASIGERFLQLLHRSEARLSPADHGEIESLFAGVPEDPNQAIAELCRAYPEAETLRVTVSDAAFFAGLSRSHPKPLPFVTTIDGEIARQWGSDTLWQSQDPRYPADAVRVIPGPVSVAAIREANEPVADILARYEDAAVARVASSPVAQAPDRWVTAPFVSWNGRLKPNPALIDGATVTGSGAHLTITLPIEGTPAPGEVSAIEFPVTPGLYPVIDRSRIEGPMTRLLNGMAQGAVPEGEPTRVTVTEQALALHSYLCNGGEAASSAMFDLAWPTVYGALGSRPEALDGLLDTVHLDHVADVTRCGVGSYTVTSRCVSVARTTVGIVLDVQTEFRDEEGIAARFLDRFALRGTSGSEALADVDPWSGRSVVETPHSPVARTQCVAPASMAPFAAASGDHNPIHLSTRAAQAAGLHAPIVHGMWLCAVAEYQAAAAAGTRIAGWAYHMLGMVDLGAAVDIHVDRVGRVRGGGTALEVTCFVGESLVARATAIAEAPTTAYLFPGQGVQAQGMALEEYHLSPAARAVWDAADKHTRESLGFSIMALVRDNPTSIVAKGVRYTHPDGLLNLTQFTQVALVTVACAQTARLREDGALVDGATFAGHSLGEYTALAAYGGVLSLEAVIDIVFQRGSAMHALVPRDSEGRSNYRMAALRPSQIGVDDVVAYVAEIAERTGEFLEVVNLNLEGEQYSVAGTVAGLRALEADARERSRQRRAKRPFVLIPGLDVPFHSRILRGGVPEFRALLDVLVPRELDEARLVGRYIPNLVARPFEVTEAFARSILEVAPSERVTELLRDFDEACRSDRANVVRTLLIELLSWQFASPVRWIETQRVMLDTGVRQWIEIGLANAPTLANLGARTVKAVGADVTVLNSSRDSARVRQEDVAELPVAGHELSGVSVAAVAAETKASRATSPEGAGPAQAAKEGSPAQAAEDQHGVHTNASATGPIDVVDIPFGAADALAVALALHAKVRPEQIGDSDTVDTLTNGVSSKRNQVLMDLTAEFGLTALDGAADTPVASLRAQVSEAAPTYRPWGSFLGEAVGIRVRETVGELGAKPQRIAEYLASEWGMSGGWVHHVWAAIALGTRDGKSIRGGDLATLGASSVEDLVDTAVAQVASAHGVPARKAPAASASNVVVDSAAVDTLSAALVEAARGILATLGSPAAPVAGDSADDAGLAEAVAAELGSGWMDFVKPAFRAEAAIRLCDRWATAREDVARIAAGEDVRGRFTGVGAEVARQARWHARRAENPVRLLDIAAEAESAENGPFAGQVAVVTGAAPRSIAASVVARLLEGGATVVMTASRITPQRRVWATDLYRRHAVSGSELWVVPANLASFRDIDALAEWIGTVTTQTSGGTSTRVKDAWVPDILFPFAAPPVWGTAGEAGPETENQARVLLWGVERLVGALAAVGEDTHVGHRLHVVLPGSPNRGTFGGDGAYGEAKASLDALVNKWSREPWGARTSLVHARIGWVRGTALMGGNDALVAAAEAAGVATWSPEKISSELVSLCEPAVRTAAANDPVNADLTRGLDGVEITGLQRDQSTERKPEASLPGASIIKALPNAGPTGAGRAPRSDFAAGTARPEDLVVIVGASELGPWGTSRSRLAAELGITRSGEVEMSAAGVMELAWAMHLIEWRDTPVQGWHDAEGTLVPEEDVYERFRDEVVARCGVRAFHNDAPLEDGGSTDVAAVRVERAVSFTTDKAAAMAHAEANSDVTVSEQDDGDWLVEVPAGSVVLVPRRATVSRTVGAQIPEGFDPALWGIPASMIESVDRLAIWNLLTAVDSFAASGFTPSEILELVHPADVASTQGSGFGGMTSIRSFYLDRFLGKDRPQDLLQETLGNVVAAHTMQSFVGGYGAMVHPVGACATAAVSIEEGVDKIRSGKASFVVAGGIDDIGIESITGFGDMTATASAQVMHDRGIADLFFSRPGDLRRGGFVEAQGGGTVLLVRGDLALEAGLPVLGVVAYAQSFADGAHTSIPAPGLGALAAARGGSESRLARELAAVGVGPDGIDVVSKHDTSTGANDPNEAEIHTLIASALGRSEGNPLYVISQKSLTGHAKGGAALFQVVGLTDAFETGLVPGNASLDCLDPVFADRDFLVWPRRPLRHRVRAGLVTSLGFGHVSALLAMAGPGAFEAAVERSRGAEAADEWRRRADARRDEGRRSLERAMRGHQQLFIPIDGRRLPQDGHDAEVAMLLDPAARLGSDGRFTEPR